MLEAKPCSPCPPRRGSRSPKTWQDFSLLTLLAAAPGNAVPSHGGISSQSPRVRSSPVGRAGSPPPAWGRRAQPLSSPCRARWVRGCYSLTPGLRSSCSPTQAAGAAPHRPISPYITPHRPTSPRIAEPPSPRIIALHRRPASSPHITQPHHPTSLPHITPTSPHLQQQLQEAGSMVRGSPPSWGGVGFPSLGVGREVQACEGLYLLRPSTGI